VSVYYAADEKLSYLFHYVKSWKITSTATPYIILQEILSQGVERKEGFEIISPLFCIVLFSLWDGRAF